MKTIKKFLTDVVTYITNLIRLTFSSVETIFKQASADPFKLLGLILVSSITADVVLLGKLGTLQYVMEQASTLTWPTIVVIALLISLKK